MKTSTLARVAVISFVLLAVFAVIVEFAPLTLPIRFVVVSILIVVCMASVIQVFRSARGAGH